MEERNKTLILVGKSLSGKTVTAKILEDMGIERIVADTTRPIREGEQDGVDYHFRTVEEFDALEKSGYYAETRVFNTVFGPWYYGTSKASYETEKNSVVVTNPYGLKEIKKNIKSDSFVSVYLHVEDSVFVERLRLRGDDEEEAKRRLKEDTEDFADMPEICDFTIHIKGDETPEEVADKVLSAFSQENTGINLAFCVDEQNGMMFNKRRQSQDVVLRERLLKMVGDMGGSLLVSPYTAKQFDEMGSINIFDKPWEHATPADIVFIEEMDPAEIEKGCKIRSLIVYKWNRLYLSDMGCTLAFDNYTLSNIRDFPGNSHEKITEEIYRR